MKFVLFILSLFLIANAFAQVETCSELFFSEYLEGNDLNKALEIYNPSLSTIDLTAYTIEVYSNGASTPTFAYLLGGSLQSHDVFVLCNPAAAAEILALADATNTVCQFNGNDAVVLLKNGEAIDIIGEIGVDPGDSWSVGEGFTEDLTLVRIFGAEGPETNWALSQSQWTFLPEDYSAGLGGHSSSCATLNTVENLSEILSVEIFPLPCSSVLNIVIKQSTREGQVEVSIYDSNGRLVERKLSSISNGKLLLDVAHYEEGSYFIEVKDFFIESFLIVR